MTNLGKKYIPDMYFAPSLKNNLRSVGQLTQKGYKVIFENNICTIFDIVGVNKYFLFKLYFT